MTTSCSSTPPAWATPGWAARLSTQEAGITRPSAGTMASSVSRLENRSSTSASMPLKALSMAIIAAATAATTTTEMPLTRWISRWDFRAHK